MRRFAAPVLVFFAGLSLAGLAVAADRLFILNKSDDTATILDAATGKALATLPVGHGPHEVAVLSDERTAAVSDYGDREKPGRTITLLDLEKGRRIGAIELDLDKLAVVGRLTAGREPDGLAGSFGR